jgi:hypothetical protein
VLLHAAWQLPCGCSLWRLGLFVSELESWMVVCLCASTCVSFSASMAFPLFRNVREGPQMCLAQTCTALATFSMSSFLSFAWCGWS